MRVADPSMGHRFRVVSTCVSKLILHQSATVCLLSAVSFLPTASPSTSCPPEFDKHVHCRAPSRLQRAVMGNDAVVCAPASCCHRPRSARRTKQVSCERALLEHVSVRTPVHSVRAAPVLGTLGQAVFTVIAQASANAAVPCHRLQSG